MESAFRAIECRLAQMNVFSHYCLTFSANDCIFSLNEQQKVYYIFFLLILKSLWYIKTTPSVDDNPYSLHLLAGQAIDIVGSK